MPRIVRLRGANDLAPSVGCCSALAGAQVSAVSARRPSDMARRPASLDGREAGRALAVVLGREAPRDGTRGKLHHSMPSSKPCNACEILPGLLDGAGPAANPGYAGYEYECASMRSRDEGRCRDDGRLADDDGRLTYAAAAGAPSVGGVATAGEPGGASSCVSILWWFGTTPVSPFVKPT